MPTAHESHTRRAHQLKVAIVHDWLVIYGGAERVLEHIIDLYPDADVFSLIDFVKDDQRHFLRGKTPITSFLQKIPGARHHYRKMLPLMPLAIEQLDLSSYDLIISSHYSVAKGVLTGPNQTHVCYCHSPMRYAWDHYHEYLREMNLERGLKSWFARWQLHRIRGWDIQSANGVDQFIANSKFVAKRISKYYRRTPCVIPPPVDTDLFCLETERDDFYVCAGRFVPFKRIDLVAQAFTSMPDKRLILIGDGPEMAKIRSKAGPNVTFTGFLPPEQVRAYLAKARAFIFPSEEDFGIVPVEAQACGTPVIAYGRGGALETVIPWPGTPQQGLYPTGVFFHEQTAESLSEAVWQFERIATELDAEKICQHAQIFSVLAFKASFERAVNEALKAG
jgi:glycosyltransferase involved in cell wall biosynthesis